MSVPDKLKFTKDHEWVDATTGTVKIGITSYAVEQLGDIVHVDLPEVGDTFEHGESFGTVESTKTVSDLYMPLSGKVIEVNNDVVDVPENVQNDAYEKGWLVKIEVTAQNGVDELMSAVDYTNFIKELD